MLFTFDGGVSHKAFHDPETGTLDLWSAGAGGEGHAMAWGDALVVVGDEDGVFEHLSLEPAALAAGARRPQVEGPRLGVVERLVADPAVEGEEHPQTAVQASAGSASAEASSSTLGQVQTRLRSPKPLSMRPTVGQYLCSRVQAAGNAATSRE